MNSTASKIRHFTKVEYAEYIAALPRTSHARGPYLMSNAGVNRVTAIKAAKAGKTVEQIAAHWPEVWCLIDGKLGQRYDYVFSDGETYETNRIITASSLRRELYT